MAARYIDPKSYHAYSEHDGQEVLVDLLLPIPVSEAFDLWLQKTFMEGQPFGIPVIETLGEGRGKLGTIRRLAGGIREKIIGVGIPDEDPRSNKIASLCLEIIGGPFPVTQHMEFVRFIPDSDGKSTYVLCGVKFFPSSWGYVLCCGGPMIRMVVRASLKAKLNKFESTVKEQRQQRLDMERT